MHFDAAQQARNIAGRVTHALGAGWSYRSKSTDPEDAFDLIEFVAPDGSVSCTALKVRPGHVAPETCVFEGEVLSGLRMHYGLGASSNKPGDLDVLAERIAAVARASGSKPETPLAVEL